MKGDRVEVVVDTGHGTQTFEIRATRAGRRLEVTTGRGVVEVTEITRGGTPVRTGRFMASRVVALVEHPALEGDGARVEIETRRRLSPVDTRTGRTRGPGSSSPRPEPTDQLALMGEATTTPVLPGEAASTQDLLREIEAATADELADA
jgi:hypothetical protein